MSGQTYTDEQNQIFIDNIKEYRYFIEDETEAKTKEKTINFGKRLIKEYPVLSDRNPKGQGVAQRLVYHLPKEDSFFNHVKGVAQ